LSRCGCAHADGCGARADDQSDPAGDQRRHATANPLPTGRCYLQVTYLVSALIRAKGLSHSQNNLDTTRIEPLFPKPASSKIQDRLYARGLRENKLSWKCRRCPARGDSRAIKQAWIAPDGTGCHHFCYHIALLWFVSGSDQIDNTSPHVSGITQAGSVG